MTHGPDAITNVSPAEPTYIDGERLTGTIGDHQRSVGDAAMTCQTQQPGQTTVTEVTMTLEVVCATENSPAATQIDQAVF